MLKPRHLPPAHKNQMFVSVQSIGFPSNNNSSSCNSPSPQPSYHSPRQHEVTKKRLPKPKPSGFIAPPPSLRTSDTSNNPTIIYSVNTNEDGDDADETSTVASSSSPSPRSTTITTKDSVNTLFHVRGRASFPDAPKTDSVSDVRREERTKRISKPPPPIITSAEDGSGDDDVSKNNNDNNTAGLKTFLTEDPTSPRSYDNRSVSCSPVLECSKYTVIGQPRYRKQRFRPTMWTLPKIDSERKSAFEDAGHLKDNSIDLRSIYGSKSKVQQVPADPVLKEDTVILPPLQIGTRIRDAKVTVDYNSLAEKRLVMQNTPRRGKASVYRNVVRDHVAFPTSYRHYFRFRQRQQKYIRTLFAKDDFWENNPKPVSCSRCVHQTTATIHYCDVLGKRFCHFCSENTNRSFSNAYENNRMLMPSPNKSPTLQMVSEEPSFVGVRKIVITKKTKDEGRGENHNEADDQGEGRDEGEGSG